MKQKFFLILGATICAVIGVTLGYLYLYWYEISPLLEAFGNTQAQIKITEEQNKFFAVAVEPDLEKYEGEFKTIKDLYFDRPYEAILFFESAAKRNNLVQTIVQPPGGEPPKISLTVTGTYENIMKFLREVENDVILVELSNVTLQGTGANMTASINATFRKL